MGRERREGENTKFRQGAPDRTWQGQDENDRLPWLLQLHSTDTTAVASSVLSVTCCYHQMGEHSHPRKKR